MTGETRTSSGREQGHDNVWVYALPNSQPEKPIRRIVCTPQNERALIFAITLTTLQDHPLRPGVRQKLHLTLPEGVKLNPLGELDNVEIDLEGEEHTALIPFAWITDAKLVLTDELMKRGAEVRAARLADEEQQTSE